MSDAHILGPKTPDIPNQDGVHPDVHMPPVKLHTTFDKTFISGLDKWQYEESGVFALGHFKGYSASDEILVMIPYQRISFFEFEPLEVPTA